VILEDIKPGAVKTGMLYDEEIVRCVVNKIKKYSLKTIVDPVLVATSGDKLARKNLVESIKNDLIPNAYMVTPNIEEAATLTGIKIDDIDDVRKACHEIYRLGSKYVLIKGGHLSGRCVHDVLFDGGNYSIFSLPRISHKKAHGSGCTLSALITGLIALGEPVEVAVEKAKRILWSMIKKGYKPGRGADVLNVSSSVVQDVYSSLLDEAHFNLWLDLVEATDKLFSFLSLEYIPEVGMNIGYALSDAKEPEDVCAIDGRIVKSRDKPVRCGRLDFGVSKHIASIILAAMEFNPEIRCAMNIKYSEENIEKYRELGFKIGFFDRVNEPKEVKSTMDWGTKEVAKKLGYVPDIIFDKGEIGKEPMIRLLGKNPKEIIEKALVLMKKS
jgi:hydroxymethylpyrimidine/phosphomethylpyrimidine kinase